MDNLEGNLRNLFVEFNIPGPLFQTALSHLKNKIFLQNPDIYLPLTTKDAPLSSEKLRPQLDDIDLLLLNLFAAQAAKAEYTKRGIPQDVYDATMGCFSRFINETYASKGIYTFDRHFWTYRQTSLRLFRLGTLEYEFIDGDAAVHIPSDASLSPKNVEESLRAFSDFSTRYFPDKPAKRITCLSWLLSPEIGSLLGPGSNIKSFQSLFEITSESKPTEDYLFWLFGVDTLQNINELKEDTSLQRGVKKHLLKGDVIHNGFGILKGRDEL